MEDKKVVVRNEGMGVLGLLQVIFIVLKVLNLIDWSWGLVLIPLWINLGFIGVVLLIALIALIIGAIANRY